jgi:hypothetical protein
LTAAATLFAALLGLGAAFAIALPLAWKWELGVVRVAAVVIAFVIISGLVVGLAAAFIDFGIVAGGLLVAFLALALGLIVLLFRFY